MPHSAAQLQLDAPVDVPAGYHPAVTWDQMAPGAAAGSPDVLRRWGELFGEYGTEHGGMYQSPEWSALLAENSRAGERAVLAVARAGGAIVGLAPLHLHATALEFNAAGRTLYRSPMVQVSVLGASPLMPANVRLHDGLFTSIHAAFPESHCVSLSAVSTGSFLSRYLQESAVLRQLYMVQLVGGVRTSYRMPLPRSFADYLAGLQRKRRYNIGREERLLREHSRGAFDFVRVDCPAAVPGFLADAEHLARTNGRTWTPAGPDQSRESACLWYSEVARRGFLCSYLLRCRGEPAAAIVGFRHGDTCLVDVTLYSQSFAPFSPGKVLLHLAIKDMMERGIRVVDFGFGNPSYGSSSALIPSEGASVVLWRRGLANRVRRATYDGFRAACQCLRPVAVGMGVWRGAGHGVAPAEHRPA